MEIVGYVLFPAFPAYKKGRNYSLCMMTGRQEFWRRPKTQSKNFVLSEFSSNLGHHSSNENIERALLIGRSDSDRHDHPLLYTKTIDMHLW